VSQSATSQRQSLRQAVAIRSFRIAASAAMLV